MKSQIDNYFARLTDIFATIDRSAVERFVQILDAARYRGSQIFFIGNGGSAATASHFANDLNGLRNQTVPFRAQSLTDNVATITAIANDYGYEEIFKHQLWTQIKQHDVVVAISASGNSPNILKAAHYANQKAAIVLGLTGFDGGELRKLCSLALHVPTAQGEYGPVEDLHLIFDHLIISLLSSRTNEVSGAV